MLDTIWICAVLVTLEASLTGFANMAMFPRLRGERWRMLFYAIGVLIFLGCWTLWAAVRRYGAEVIVSAWVSAALCGLFSLAAHKVREFMAHVDRTMTLAAMSQEGENES